MAAILKIFKIINDLIYILIIKFLSTRTSDVNILINLTMNHNHNIAVEERKDNFRETINLKN